LILYAIPTPLGGRAEAALPVPALATIRTLKDFAVENAKSARAFLAEIGMPVRELNIVEIEKGGDLLRPLREGRPLGLLSEAGCPAIADPGATLVEAAHREGFRVLPLIGPSSLMLALMASGLQGQRFAFCGYLPRESTERENKIRQVEKRSRQEDETQIFIETPYRNDALLASVLSVCSSGSRLCVATDLTLPGESVRTMSILAWKKAPPAIGKRPTVFLLLGA
jgi:16S rRNA (cytidine1402-2'-O)-methyltransferase